ncbi:chemotaxis response regulator protein-glutamate methylesterase [Paucibacter sp. DJ2R-2]|uniref:protein-glutamate methylesterase/protein-glutamine glutaminase n=1 Tax=Paucibacter sp. DJ2R-2 TaxID=2893558 RepID=UPI0021E4F2BF|nr:chemotaxis response regulator protein-glutamate methylesterase [Paucibacter sp. DJ2R-2]MCV2421864.1 chemotaxis response regulator protein-glutamate methylesterase [Paucibacter sp. DJ4R-1]MCV2439519.1 chemotaxis response regulator protein-glutamate methylesterase [Paucibacter sp. DJ2R-2]
MSRPLPVPVPAHAPAAAGRPLRVAVIDDSAVVRKHLSALLEAAGIEVSITASDPLFAWPKLEAAWPDVIVLDVEMPRMDGISFLKRVMSEHPTPVVMCSTLTEAGCETTMEALAAGAVGFVTKPKLGLRDFLEDPGNGLVPAVRAAARANVRALPSQMAAAIARPSGRAAVTEAPLRQAAMAQTTDRVIAFGSSTGGVQTIEAVLRQLPRTMPGIVLVQHMPEKFTHSFAARLDSICALEVLEAKDGDRVINGRVLVAPGGRHMQLRRSGAQYVVEVRDGPLVSHHKPSVDVLFKSVAQAAGRNAIGAIFTGMGEDGARGLLDMRRAGASTLAQDEASCVVYGMPKAAAELGAAEHIVALSDMPLTLQALAGRLP